MFALKFSNVIFKSNVKNLKSPIRSLSVESFLYKDEDATLRSRLIYQSSMRGSLENCILLGGFTKKFIHKIDHKQLKELDMIINSEYDDWSIYEWITVKKGCPKQFEGTVMEMMRNYCKNRLITEKSKCQSQTEKN
ncbi:hypothetical protein A3Q56_02787 [Intoshia linei]|uniref:SDH assembly factor 2 n=1 Tax=Intoshia linei TaxID=1819745 RepID=A0A177B5E5_9BILA|nr:hypothetical protein A3Q56_02787 [Intoshia linei]